MVTKRIILLIIMIIMMVITIEMTTICSKVAHYYGGREG